MPLDTDEAISYCRAPPRGGKKRLVERGGGAEWQGQDGGSRTYSRHTTSSCFIHRFETNSKRVLFVACFLFVTDNVVVLLLSELSGLYLPVQGCIEDIRTRREISSLRQFYFSSFLFPLFSLLVFGLIFFNRGNFYIYIYIYICSSYYEIFVFIYRYEIDWVVMYINSVRVWFRRDKVRRRASKWNIRCLVSQSCFDNFRALDYL